MRVARDDQQRLELRPHHRATSGERVCRRPGGCGDEHAVAAERRHRPPVHLEHHLEDTEPGPVLDARLVERPASFDDLVVHPDEHVQRHAVFDAVFPAHHLSERLVEVLGLRFREEPDPAQIDAEDRNGRGLGEFRRPEERPVPTEDEHHLATEGGVGAGLHDGDFQPGNQEFVGRHAVHRFDAGAVDLVGDGTFLRAAELAQAASIPVLGINLGRIGFLAETEAEHLDEALAQVVRREYRIEHRMTLDVLVRVDDEIIERGWALNEASIENRSRLGVLEVVLEVDGRPVSAFGCDGVLISTPTGSTAYAFSAGGPVVWPELEALLVVPSNAHALFARPLVTSPNSLIAVETVAGSHDGLVFCDGRRTLELPAGARVEVVRGKEPVRWIRLDSAPFADRMVRKFELPVTGWRGRKP